jgi:hypothetical protein
VTNATQIEALCVHAVQGMTCEHCVLSVREAVA